jgi:hypothetical protein
VLILGASPGAGRVVVVPGQEWRCGLQAVTPAEVPQAWPTGVVARIEWQVTTGSPPAAWAAAIDVLDPTILRWTVPAATVDAVIAAKPVGFRLVVDGGRWVEGCLIVWGA